MNAEKPPLKARPLRFDWSNTPLHWIPEDPFATHLINGLHVIAPVAERWFVKVYKEALPKIQDERLRADVRGFMGQESMHALAHNSALEYLRDHGIDTDDYVALFERVCHMMAMDPCPLPLPEDVLLKWRLSLVAAGEQITCVLGDWVIEAEALDAAGADETMLDMLRWHGAEEVEHREVAFDLLRHLAGDAEYPLRVAGMAVTFPIIMSMWVYSTAYMLERDPELKGRRFSPFEVVRVSSQGRIPGWDLFAAVGRYLDPNFHPAQEGSLERAAATLAKSPAMRAAQA